MSPSRYIIGIDLGTTNSAIAYADTGAGDQPTIHVLPIPQLVQAGAVEERQLLPSFLYLPKAGEQPAGSLKLPWDEKRDYAVGEFARNFGAQVPTRLVASAKSWLCHPGIDRKAPVLPWKAPDDARKVSPLEATTLFLKHLCEAWNHRMVKDAASAGHRFEQQDVILTVPASFDAAARDLTVEAARAAGLEHVTLLEEPQAAFYSWIESSQDKWRKQVEVGDVVLVCDLGGGTTDLTLIAVDEADGQLALQRVAVGDHILLGGDNMDLALAHHAAKQFAKQNVKLDAGQMLQFWHSARLAKEQLFANPKLMSHPVTALGRGSKVIGGTLKTELTRAEMEQVLIDGFFPECPADVEPARQRAAGFQELGLPYAADPAVSKHLAAFIRRNAEVIAERTPARKKKKLSQPTAVLFNGGVFKGTPLQERMASILNQWSKSAGGVNVRVLQGTNLDLAVARGAAYYGMVRRGKGVRIRGGTARAYYVGIETSLPAVPGMPPPLKALCVVPFGMEEGTETDVPSQEFGLIVGEQVRFRFLGSTQRRNDPVGTVVEDWEGQIEELNPLEITLEASDLPPSGGRKSPEKAREGATIPVRLHSKVTPIGTLELWCHSRDGKQKWKLEFNVRERPQDAGE
jgi:molecular chaperone DnaK (HSP70)